MFNKKAILVVLLMLSLMIQKMTAQLVTDIVSCEASTQDKIFAMATDASGNIFVNGSAANQLYFNGTPVTYLPNSYSYLFKLDANKNLIWYKVFNYVSNGYTSLATDNNGNIYVSTDYFGTFNLPPYTFNHSNNRVTFKLDSTGNIVWAMDMGGFFFSDRITSYLEFKTFYSWNDSIGGQEITNNAGVVANFDLNGNYIRHFQVDSSGFQNEFICGKDSSGTYFGFRSPLANTNVTDKFELFRADSLGNILLAKIVHYGNQYSLMRSLVTDGKNYYYAAFLHNRIPLNSSTGTILNTEMLVKADSSFNVVSVLQLGPELNLGAGGDVIYLNVINGELFMSAKIQFILGNALWSHLGQSNFLSPYNYNLFFAKLSEELQVRWWKRIPSTDYANSFSAPILHNSRLLYRGATDTFMLDGKTFQSIGGNGGFILEVKDDSTKSIVIEGNVFKDLNQDGLISAGETPVSAIGFNNLQIMGYYAYSEQNGKYSIPGINGTQVIKSLNLPEYWARSTPDTLQVLNISNDTVISGINFGIYPIPGIVNLHSDITALTDARPGFDIVYKIDVCNTGTDTVNAFIKVKQDSSLFFVGSSLPADSVSSDTIYFSTPLLEPDSCYSFLITDSVANNFMLLGSYLHEEVYANSSLNDTVPEDNNSENFQLVIGSFDPNHIEVIPSCDISDSFIQRDEALTYTIRFQNTGTANAVNVTVIDTLSSSFDLSRFEYISSSHQVQYSINNHVLKLHFPNIQLVPDSVDFLQSIGYFKFKIKPLNSVSIGQQIKSTAYIYFDFNAPIITNTAVTQVRALQDMISITAYAETCKDDGYFIINPQCPQNDLFVSSGNGVFMEMKSNIVDSLQHGSHFFTIVSGKDTVTESVLIPYSPVSSVQPLVICEGDSALVNNVYISQSGLYNDTLNTLSGCDSLVQVQVTVQSIDTAISVYANFLAASVITFGAQYQWIDCGNGNAAIVGENTAYYYPTSSGSYALSVSKNGCSDTSACHNFIVLGTEGFQQNQLIVFTHDMESGKISASFLSAQNFVTLEIINSTGQLVERKEFRQSSHCATYLKASSGCYFVRIITDKGEINSYKVIQN